MCLLHFFVVSDDMGLAAVIPEVVGVFHEQGLLASDLLPLESPEQLGAFPREHRSNDHLNSASSRVGIGFVLHDTRLLTH